MQLRAAASARKPDQTRNARKLMSSENVQYQLWCERLARAPSLMPLICELEATMLGLLLQLCYRGPADGCPRCDDVSQCLHCRHSGADNSSVSCRSVRSGSVALESTPGSPMAELLGAARCRGGSGTAAASGEEAAPGLEGGGAGEHGDEDADRAGSGQEGTSADEDDEESSNEAQEEDNTRDDDEEDEDDDEGGAGEPSESTDSETRTLRAQEQAKQAQGFAAYYCAAAGAPPHSSPPAPCTAHTPRGALRPARRRTAARSPLRSPAPQQRSTSGEATLRQPPGRRSSHGRRMRAPGTRCRQVLRTAKRCLWPPVAPLPALTLRLRPVQAR
jgi:hypothetical protein